jgi:hypothetical protein
MKNILLTTSIITVFLFTTETNAQVGFQLNLNLGNRPSWGMPGNYSGEFYYLPEIDCYYHIPQRKFIYFDGGNWISSFDLPNRYRNYDLFGGIKIVINEQRPYLRPNYYREQYFSYYDRYNHHYAPIVAVPRYNERYEHERFERRKDDDRDRDRDRDRDHDRRRRW